MKKKGTKALVILTGGKSTRMGSDKGSLPFGRHSVLEYMTEKCRPYFDQVYISAARAPEVAHGDGVCVVPDIIPERGPLGGLYSVLKKIREEEGSGICVTAVDTPFTDPQHLLSLMPRDDSDMAQNCMNGIVAQNSSGGATHSDGGDVLDYCVFEEDGGRLQPLCGWYSVTCLEKIEKMLAKNNGRMMDLLKMARGKVVRVAAEPIFGNYPVTEFFNMNDRDSYYMALDIVRKMETKIPLISFAAWSGTGKTTYIEKLIPKLTERGIKVAVIKHDGHDFEIDVEGKDTYRYKKAGAVEVVIASSKKMARICSLGGEIPLEMITSDIKGVDLIIAEGYKYGPQPKIELHRSDLSEKLMENIPNRVAVVSDIPWKVGIPSFLANDIESVCEFLCNFTRAQKPTTIYREY